ncbi:MAG TPA: hypothetical protein VEX38_07105 [Fimbriimonadaceae bacterium]|nr:hypothetical protein [Fimbriimonadaceae bacterium]
MIIVRAGDLPGLRRLLETHPRIELSEEAASAALEFNRGGWPRAVHVDKPDLELGGLLELMDNNPLVCADEISVPSPEATLALTAVGPLIRAGLLSEPPTLLFSFDADEGSIYNSFAAMGWSEGATVSGEPVDLQGVLALTAICVVRSPDELDDLDSLYEESFGRSFYVRRDEASEWDVELVKGKPWAVFRLRISPDQPTCLLTIRVMADAQGKCGAAQVVHAMNVMSGFEESLGLNG